MYGITICTWFIIIIVLFNSVTSNIKNNFAFKCAYAFIKAIMCQYITQPKINATKLRNYFLYNPCAIPRAGVGVLDDVHLKIVVKLWFLGILILS